MSLPVRSVLAGIFSKIHILKPNSSNGSKTMDSSVPSYITPADRRRLSCRHYKSGLPVDKSGKRICSWNIGLLALELEEPGQDIPGYRRRN